jgi:hypothetical protein
MPRILPPSARVTAARTFPRQSDGHSLPEPLPAFIDLDKVVLF